jgi:dipeptidyl aminopeptidase/acylaminoacyl peptidase
MIPPIVRKIAFGLLLFASAPLWSTTEKPRVSVADCIGMTALADPGYFEGLPSIGRTATFSPDGKQFIVVLRKGDLKRSVNVYSLLLFGTGHPATPQNHVELELTSSSNRDAISQVRWLSDNKTIAFIGSSGDGSTQVFTYNFSQHRLRRMTDHATPVTSFGMTDDGETTVFTAEEPVSQPTSVPGRAIAPNEQLYELLSGHPDPNDDAKLELYVKRRNRREIPVKMEEVSDDDYADVRIAVSPDGKHAVVPVKPMTVPKAWEGYEEKFLAFYVRAKRPPLTPANMTRFNLVDTLTGKVRPLIEAPISYDHPRGATWTSNRTITVKDTYLPLDASPSENEIRKNKTFDVEVNIDSGELKTVQGEGSAQKQLPLDVHIQEDFQHPPKLVAIDPKTKAVTVLQDLNPQLSELQLGRVEEFVWHDVDGGEIKGALTYPVDYQAGQRYPLVIQTHGFNSTRFSLDGPWGMASAFAAQPLASKGFFVLQSPDASAAAYGRKITNTPQEGPTKMQTYERAIAELDRQGFIDPTRVGIVGFSRTYFSVGYTLAHSKYKIGAAILADGIDGGYFQYLAFQRKRADIESLYGGTPYGPAQPQWIKDAPGFNLEKVSAPVLLIALGGSSLLSNWEWYSGLSRAQKPVDLIYLPDGPHLLIKPSERAYAQQAVVDWFCFWLGSDASRNSIASDELARWQPLRSGAASN